jgi:ABC-type transport system substrate-binding protein
VKRILIGLMICTLTLLVGASIVGSQDGRGLVRINRSDASFLGSLFPTLYRIQPETGLMEGASPDNLVLAINPQPTDEREQTIRLRDDLTWGNGESVTAWDVLWRLLTQFSPGHIDALTILDDYTIQVQYVEPNCANVPRTYPPVFRTTPRFQTFAREFVASRPGLIAIDDWEIAMREQGLSVANIRASDHVLVRLRKLPGQETTNLDGFVDGDRTIRLIDLEFGISPEDAFLNHQVNLLINPAFNRRADLLRQDDVQVYEAPGWQAYYMVFNFADTEIPRSAFTAGGQLLDQGRNRFFSDLRLRQAVQLGIDIQSIIEVVYQGSASPLAGSLSPVSWGANPALQPTAYDPGAAERLLDAAGWVDIDGDGIRNCYRCQTAEYGTSLSARIAVQPDADELNRVIEMIALQLRRIGIGVGTGGSAASQNVDLYFTRLDESSAFLRSADPDQSTLLTRAADIIGSEGNVGSYYNPALEDLLQRAHTVPGCTVEERAALYREAQVLLAEEIPVIGLYTVHDFYLARGIQGFDPRPGDPFWNITNWRVTQ